MPGRKWMLATVFLCAASPERLAAQAHAGDADDCAGIPPDGLPESRTVVTPRRDGQVCGSVAVDGNGNVATEAGDESLRNVRWHIFNRDGDATGSFLAQLSLAPQPQGFQGFELELRDPIFGPEAIHSHWDADGTRRTASRYSVEFCAPSLQGMVSGGSQFLRECGALGGYYDVTRFDSVGQVVGRGSIPDRLRGGVAAVDQSGLTLVVFPDASAVGYAPEDFVARWYDENGAPVSDLFLLFTSTENHSRAQLLLRQLIGGGLVVQLNGEWVAMSPSGMAKSSALPDWLVPYSNYDLEIVRSGRAHALIPKDPVPNRNTIALHSISGRHCGDVTFPLPIVTVGMDGTAASSTGDDRCTTTWWPQVLP